MTLLLWDVILYLEAYPEDWGRKFLCNSGKMDKSALHGLTSKKRVIFPSIQLHRYRNLLVLRTKNKHMFKASCMKSASLCDNFLCECSISLRGRFRVLVCILQKIEDTEVNGHLHISVLPETTKQRYTDGKRCFHLQELLRLRARTPVAYRLNSESLIIRALKTFTKPRITKHGKYFKVSATSGFWHPWYLYWSTEKILYMLHYKRKIWISIYFIFIFLVTFLFVSLFVCKITVCSTKILITNQCCIIAAVLYIDRSFLKINCNEIIKFLICWVTHYVTRTYSLLFYAF
jgi:hypothetical protein